MKTAKITVELIANPEQVFDVMADNKNYAWRSDVERIEVSADGNEFTEYTKSGIATRFVIQEKRRGQKYAFSIYNKRFTGYWEGIFTPLPSGGTKLELTENITFKSKLLELTAGKLWNLEKVQQTYVADLRRALGEG